jgi:ribose transport system ATP-binding protein
LDEPTAVLATREVENLFRIMREFRDQGRALAFVSHRLDEVLKIADQITVLKDGRNAGALPNKNVDNNDLISLMVGKEFEEIFIKEEKTTKDEVLLKVENLSVGDKVRDVSFSIRSGEIVALGGLEGHGQQTILEALFGLHRYRGHVSLEEKPIRLTGPREAIRKGIMMITDDRKGEGLALDLSVLHNLEVLNYNRFSNKAGVINPAKEKALAAEVISRLAIKTPYMSQMVKYLSGGNQQKVMIGRISYLPRVRLLLFKELTRGVDVGAKIEIYNLLHDMVKGAAGDSGIGILFYSSDMLEILGLSDRIIGIYDGRVTAVLKNKDLNEEKLMGEIIKGAGWTEGDDAMAEPAAEVL